MFACSYPALPIERELEGRAHNFLLLLVPIATAHQRRGTFQAAQSAQRLGGSRTPAQGGLVVLSACQTALGKEIKGEGLVGLTRGFMYAGAPRVVASLWNVDDRATAELMKRFYGAMFTKGMRPAAALRAAQTSLRREKGWAAPYYWAAFTLQGEWK